MYPLPGSSFYAVESTTDQKGEGIEQIEAETAASKEGSWSRQLGAQGSRVLGRGLRELGVPLLSEGEGASRGTCTRQGRFK